MTERKPRAGRHGPKIAAEVIEKARELRQSGMSAAKVAAQLGIGRSTVHAYTRDLGVDARAWAAAEYAMANTPEWLSEAQALYASGVSRNQIATRLGAAKSSVYRALETTKAPPS